MNKIKKIVSYLEQAVDKVLEARVSPLMWLLNFAGIVVLRLFLDKFIAKGAGRIVELDMDIHNFLFFGLTFLLVWAYLSLIFGKKPSAISHLMLTASLLVIFPPIFDLIKTGGEVFWSPYLFSSLVELKWQFLTFFGHLPSGMLYFGTRITFFGAIIFLSGIVYLKTKNLFRTFLAGFGVYAILFFMASFPTLFTYLYYFFEGSKEITQIQGFHVAQFFSTGDVFAWKAESLKYEFVWLLNAIYFVLISVVIAILAYVSNREKFMAVLKNSRFAQVIYHWGLFFCGFGLGWWFYPENFQVSIFAVFSLLTLLSSIYFAWQASVVPNDIQDLEIDKLTNSARPLPKNIFTIEEFSQLGIFFFAFSLLGGLIVSAKFFVLFLTYQIIAWFYSSPVFRLKRIPVLATFLSAIATINVFFMGFLLFSGQDDIEKLPWRIIFLLLISFTLCLPIKDFKDMASDRKNRVWTLPAILGEEKGRLILGINFFFCYMLSVFLLNEQKLFWWALLFGAVSFWAVNNKKINPRHLPWWGLGIIFPYGLILVKIVFL